VNLARSFGRQLLERNEPITVNCVCPGVVATALTPDTVLDAVPKEMQTPVSTVVSAIEEFLADATITGEAAECSGTDIIYRPTLSFGNEAAAFTNGGEFVANLDVKALQAHGEARSQFYAKMDNK
jgi:NAD(P)-dependent dehydrogenase (short-subunit alcohol dehydrogenase family)